jgi:hypothetical protein
MLSTPSPRLGLRPAPHRRHAPTRCIQVATCGAKKGALRGEGGEGSTELVVLTKKDLKRALRTAVAVALDQLLVALDTDASVFVDPLEEPPKRRTNKKKKAAAPKARHRQGLSKHAVRFKRVWCLCH